MNKNRTRMIFIMMLVFLGVLVFAAVFVPGASAKTITVDDSGGKDYTKIQDAIDNATTGDTVYVYRGVYYVYDYTYPKASIEINKSINLVGENNENTILMGYASYEGKAIRITTNYVNITNFRIDNIGIGIHLDAGSNVSISYNVISNNGYSGIYLVSSSHNNISFNKIMNARTAIDIFKSSNNIFLSNIIENCTQQGIMLKEGHDNTIVGNIIRNNSEESISMYGTSGIFLYTTLRNKIISNTISNNMYGIILSYATDNNVSTNILTNSFSECIQICFSSNNNTVISNSIMTGHKGIGIWSSSKNNISANNIYGNGAYGLYLESGEGNTAYNNWWGSTSGPYNTDSNPNGKGDNISSNISFSPWATSPFNIISEPKKESKGFIPGFETVLLIASVSCISLFRRYRRIK